MDIMQFKELVDEMILSKDIIEMYDDILWLKKYLRALCILKGKFNKGAIEKGVNISIAPLNKKYNTCFKCEKDDDFVIVLTSLIKHIETIGNQMLNKKVKEEIAKKIVGI